MLKAKNPPTLSAPKHDPKVTSFFESPMGLALFSPNYSTKHVPRAVYQRRAYDQGWMKPSPHKPSPPAPRPQSREGRYTAVKREDRTRIQSISQSTEDILSDLREAISKRGVRGIFSFHRVCQENDLDRSGKLTRLRFEKTLKDATISIAPEAMDRIFENYGYGKQRLAYDDLIKGIRGELRDSRKEAVLRLFKHFDKGKDGKINKEEVKAAFNPAGHPGFINDHRSLNEITLEFLDTFYGLPPRLSVSAFLGYFANISMSYIKDEGFLTMLKGCWPIMENDVKPEAESTSINTVGFPAASSVITKPVKRDFRLVYKRYDPARSVVTIGQEEKTRMGRMGAIDRDSDVVLPIPYFCKTIKTHLRPSAGHRPCVSFAGLIRRLQASDPRRTEHMEAKVYENIMTKALPLLTAEVMESMISHYSTERGIAYMRFINDIRGEMSPLRLYVSDQSFTRLDVQKRGFLDIHQLYAAYNCTCQSEWLQGLKTREQLFQQELEAGFDGSERPDQITKEMFRNYWANRGAVIDDDNVFSLLVFTTFQPRHPQLKDVNRSMVDGRQMSYLV